MTFKAISERFATHPGYLPSDFVSAKQHRSNRPMRHVSTLTFRYDRDVADALDRIASTGTRGRSEAGRLAILQTDARRAL